MITDKRNTKFQRIVLFLLLPVFVFVIAYGFWHISQEDKLLEVESKEAVATVTDVYSSSRGTWVKYEFDNDGKTFSNSIKYLNIYGTLEPGDKFKIIFAKSDPSVNRVLRNEDKSLRMIKNE